MRAEAKVRKAGGVFYTPRYVVDYIVEKTLGPLLEGRSPAQVEQLKILDPACGTGCFLLPAYERLLSWHLDWYVSQPKPERFLRGPDPLLSQDAQGRYVLCLPERKRILSNNIFGVDIDPRAVEIARRSLLSKMFEGEPGQARRMERVPHLRCGNTLVGFDWHDPQAGFGAVMAAGGFDAIIGNPPYRRERDFKKLLDEIADSSFGRTYRCPRMDLWYYFVHRAMEHLKPEGRLSFIVNSYWTSGTGAEALIGTFRDQCHIEEFFLLGKARVFDDVSGQHMIFVAAKGAPRSATTVRRLPQDYAGSALPYVEGRTSAEEYQKAHDELFREGRIDLQPASADVLALVERGAPLGELGDIRQGIAENPADINRRTNERFGDKWEIGEGVFSLSEEELRALQLSSRERKLARPYHDLQDIGRYWARQPPSRYLLYLTRDTCPDLTAYPGLEKHLLRFKEIMQERRETRNGARAWWQLHWPRAPELWTSDKILALQMAERPSFAFVPGECYVPFSVNVFVPRPATGLTPHYILGILNSRLLWKWFSHHAKRRGIGLDLNGNVLSRAPVLRIDFDNPTQVKLHERISTLAKHRSHLSQRQVENVERQIDLAVYELYGLTEAQRATVDAETQDD
jgi:adenine-specific DNA-methyltransferase